MIRHEPDPFPFDQLEMLLKEKIGARFHLGKGNRRCNQSECCQGP
jgi:hypothetical protein